VQRKVFIAAIFLEQTLSFGQRQEIKPDPIRLNGAFEVG
jgi:hypothetical protein